MGDDPNNHREKVQRGQQEDFDDELTTVMHGCSSSSVKKKDPSSNGENRTKSSAFNRNWLMSFSLRRKTKSKSKSTTNEHAISECHQLNCTEFTGNRTENSDDGDEDEDEDVTNEGKKRQKKENRSFFQRFKRKMGMKFLLKSKQDDNTNRICPKSAESVNERTSRLIKRTKPTTAPTTITINPNVAPMGMEETIRMGNLLQENHETIDSKEVSEDEKIKNEEEGTEELQYTKSERKFTDNYRGYVVKKWLEQETGPNLIMFKACSEMLNHVWYWGEISRQDAQKQLTDKPSGSFLIRDSESSGSQFTLSFRICNCTLHYRIQHRDNFWFFEELHYESIVHLIEDIMSLCVDGNFVCFVKAPSEMHPPFPVMLKYPISRYLKLPSLQDLCRRKIQQFIDINEMKKLPIPLKLQNYLEEKITQIV